MRVVGSLVCLCSLIAVSCSDKNEQTAPTAGSRGTEPDKTAPAAADNVSPEDATPTAGAESDARYACAKDEDCTNSCSQGAVGLAWYQAAFPGGESCQDGCNDKLADAPRCVGGQCAAFSGGKPRGECTRKAGTIESPGPAHRCTTDEDCMLTCTYGAVSKQWHAHGATKGECRDGCTSKGWEPPRCEKSMCVAYRGGKPDPSCTGRSIW